MASSHGRHGVVVTGLGPHTSIGSGVEGLWEGVLAGRSGAQHTDLLPPEEFRVLKSRVGAPAAEPSAAQCALSERESSLVDPATKFALAGAAMALADAGFATTPLGDRRNRYRVEDLSPERIGVVLGTGIGGLRTLEESHRKHVLGQKLRGPWRYSLPMLIPNALPAQIAIKYGLHGECKAVATACAAGTMAIGDAYRLIRDGELDVVLTGGVDKILSTSDAYGFMGFDLLNTMSTRNDEPAKASRPFDLDRDGFVLGEGAGVLVLEREEHAAARGARTYCRIAGYGATCDAHSMMQLAPSGDQIVRCIERALASADLTTSDIRYINAHGTSTRQNDAQEAGALRRVFGADLRDVVVNSTKAMTGHGIGASGGIEAVVTALTIARGIVHRCVNLETPDPACDLPLPRENVTVGDRVAALSNSFGFGGHNSSVVLASV